MGGNYIAAGVTGVGLNVINVGNNALSLRLFIDGSLGDAASTDPIVIPPGSGWRQILLSTKPDDLAGAAPTALSDVTSLRLYHGVNAIFPGGAIVAQLGIDNVTAVPEPTTSLLLGIGVIAMLILAAARRPRPADSRLSGSCRLAEEPCARSRPG